MKNLFWLLVICSTLAVSCLYLQSVEIINETDSDISIVDLNDQLDSTQNNIEYYINNPIYKQSIGQISQAGGSPKAMSNYINRGPKKKLYLYIFKTDTLTKYHGIKSMNELMREHKYFEIMQFSEEQLNNTDWKIRIN